MGMYTELHMNVILKHETPWPVIQALSYMCGNCEQNDDGYYIQENHVLFDLDKTGKRWKQMLKNDCAYFPFKNGTKFRFDTYYGTWFLEIKCSLKNYQNEIQKFIDWIMPHVLVEGKEDGYMLGYYRYENNALPTIIGYEHDYKSKGEWIPETQVSGV